MADEEKKVADEGQTEEAPKEAVATEEVPQEAVNNEETPTEQVVAEEVKPEEAQQKIVPGMVIRVHVKIREITPKGDERERIQVFEGTVIAKKGSSAETSTITVRKISGGVGVERIFPLRMPAIEKIEVIKRYRTRRSKLYFLRGKTQKRMKEAPVGNKKADEAPVAKKKKK